MWKAPLPSAIFRLLQTQIPCALASEGQKHDRWRECVMARPEVTWRLLMGCGLFTFKSMPEPRRSEQGDLWHLWIMSPWLSNVWWCPPSSLMAGVACAPPWPSDTTAATQSSHFIQSQDGPALNEMQMMVNREVYVSSLTFDLSFTP